MLSSSRYSFTKHNLDDFDEERTFLFFGDNLMESMDVIRYLAEYNDDRIIFKGMKYISLSAFVYVYEFNGKEYYFIALPYYHNGELPSEVRRLITNIDKPDVIVYSLKDKKTVMGFETTSTTLAGNATWQRSGRTIDFLKKDIPFAFLAYGSKIDQSDTNPSKKPRKPSALFVLFYMILTLKYKTPALMGFFEHSDPKQSEGINVGDLRENVFKYLFSLMFERKNEWNQLKKCFTNMCDYYKGDTVSRTEFSLNVREMIEDNSFADTLLDCVKNKKKGNPVFDKNNINFKWKPKKMSDYIRSTFPTIDFYQLSRNCKAGITYDTEKLIKVINSRNTVYCDSYFENENEPTIIIPIHLTKYDDKKGELVATDDPYNGEISAFSEMYLQSFPNANIMILLSDHSKNNEYDVKAAETRKIYKSISNYASIVVDLDLQIFNKTSNVALQDSQRKYKNIKITEDSVTCFFGSILTKEGINPSFINPPCGTWSDMRLYPSDMFYYYKRKDERADIAFYNLGTYYVGESKENWTTLQKTIDREYKKVKTIEKIIKSKLSNKDIIYDTFCLFYGTKEEASIVFKKSKFDYAAVINDDEENIYLEIIERD